VLPLAWVALYALHAWLLGDQLVEISAHLKVALFCTSACAWWMLALHVAPRVHKNSLVARAGIILTFLAVFTVLSILLRSGLASDPVWQELLRNPIVFWLPVIMFWISPPAQQTD
jgi:hypothetical protein